MKTRKSKDNVFSLVLMALLLPLIFTSIAFLISCGGGGGGGTSTSNVTTGTVTTYITDPPVCKVPNGTLQNVWVTITRVRAHISGDAGPDDRGWVDLVDLRDDPTQIDLLNLDDTQGLLAQLGSTSGLTAGKYQQIRLYLLSNTPSATEEVPKPNECEGFGYNCVVEEDRPHTLILSSQAHTGIKIPPGQIAGGGLTVTAGRLVDLVIDFDACSSIVRQGNGQYRLKPTLRAGAVSLTDSSLIRGRVVDGATMDPISNAIVLLEVRDVDNSTIDRVYAQKFTDLDGRFAFGPLPAGTYDVVAAARTASHTYNATVTLEVPLGRDMGDIPLVSEAGGPATIEGTVTTQIQTGTPPTISLTGMEAIVELVALQAVSGDVFTGLKVTVPLFAGSSPRVVTADSACPDDTFCGGYSLVVPASNPQVGTFSSPPTSYEQYMPESGGVEYYVNARAYLPGDTEPFGSQTTEPYTVTADGITIVSTIGFIFVP